jgi:hypothetical protein
MVDTVQWRGDGASRIASAIIASAAIANKKKRRVIRRKVKW